MRIPVEDAVYTFVRADSALLEYFGDRIFPDVAPEGTQDPWLVYQVINNEAHKAHDGDNDLHDSYVQLTAWTKDASKRKLIMMELLRVLTAVQVVIQTRTVTFLHQDDRTFSDDGPPRFYAAQVDVTVSL